MPLLTRHDRRPAVGRHRRRARSAELADAPRRPADLRRRARRRGRRARAGRARCRARCGRSSPTPTVSPLGEGSVDAALRARPSASRAGLASTRSWASAAGRTSTSRSTPRRSARPADGRGRDHPRARRASPRRSRRSRTRRAQGSYGVPMPIAARHRPRLVRQAPRPRCVRSGIGDVISNLSAIADWELAGRERGEPVDGLAVAMARTAARPSILHRAGRRRRRRLPDRAGRGARALRPRDGRRPAPAGPSRRRPRDPPRDRPALPRHGRATASWSAWRALFCALPARRPRDGGRHRRGACAATGCRARPASSGSATSSSRPRCSTRRRPARTASRSWNTWTVPATDACSACPRVCRGLRSMSCAPSCSRASIFAAQQRRALGRAALHAPDLAALTRLLVPTPVTPNGSPT